MEQGGSTANGTTQTLYLRWHFDRKLWQSGSIMSSSFIPKKTHIFLGFAPIPQFPAVSFWP